MCSECTVKADCAASICIIRFDHFCYGFKVVLFSHLTKRRCEFSLVNTSRFVSVPSVKNLFQIRIERNSLYALEFVLQFANLRWGPLILHAGRDGTAICVGRICWILLCWVVSIRSLIGKTWMILVARGNWASVYIGWIVLKLCIASIREHLQDDKLDDRVFVESTYFFFSSCVLVICLICSSSVLGTAQLTKRYPKGQLR